MTKVVIKKKNVKASREKKTFTYKEYLHKSISGFFSRNFADHKGVMWYIQSVEKKKSATKNTLSRKAIIQHIRRNKVSQTKK